MTIPNLPSLWAMQPEALTALADTLNQGPDARGPGRSEEQQAPLYTVEDGLAVIPVQGAMSKHGLQFFGWRLLFSMREIAAALKEVAADTSVRAIMLDVDSPGGTVDGIEELALAVRTAAAAKPLYAWADGLMASAAYWMASGARRIAAPATAQVGSIGVISMHREFSKALEGAGVRYTILAAGHYKAAGNTVEPLSDEMRAYLQEGIDAVYELFLSAVEQGRGVSREKTLAMADGKIFIAGEALKAGLIDRICSREEFIKQIKQEWTMNLAELRAQHPELEQELRAELEKDRAPALENARAEGAKEEQARLIGLVCAVLGDAAETLKTVVQSGVTVEQIKALQPLMQPAAKAGTAQPADPDPYRKDALDALGKAAASPADVALDQPAGDDFMALVNAKVAEGKTKGQAMHEVARDNPEAHAVWLKNVQKESK